MTISYIKTLRTIYSHAIPELEDIYNECKFDNNDLSLNELIIQYHFSHLMELGKLTGKNMMKNLPKQYHWIVRKFLKHQVKKVITVRWKPACDLVREALAWNQDRRKDLMVHIQETNPVKHSVCV